MTDGNAWYVLREHCPAAGIVGLVVQVEEIVPAHPAFRLICMACQARYAENEAHALLAGRNEYHPAAWLTKLPPITEETTTREEIAA